MDMEAIETRAGWGPFADRVKDYRRLLFTPTGKLLASSTENRGT